MTFNWKQLALPALLLFAVLLNKGFNQPPTALPASSDPTVFSSERAMDHVRAIAVAPHPVGTPENAVVRAYLVDHLKNAGLEVETQHTQVIDTYRTKGVRHYGGISSQAIQAATVTNVMGHLKGTGQSGKALLLMSHYDSVYYGPGAGDDASGTAALLETLRALQAGPPLQNDVIFLLTDAEEVGLYGAQAFFGKHPWADDVGLVVNFEARGSKGTANMFQTSQLNNILIEKFASAAQNPIANSLTVTIYRNMPNDTDLSISLKAGIPGINFAFIDGFYDYHTEGDNAENLDPDTLQHLGAQALAMAQVFGNETLPLGDTSELVFFDFLMMFLISYPLWLSWAVAALAAGLFALYARNQISSGEATLGGIVRSSLSGLMLIVIGALVIDLLFLMIGGRSSMVEGRRLFAISDTVLLGFVFIALALTTAWFGMLKKGITHIWPIAGGVLAVLLYVYEPSPIPAAVVLVLSTMLHFMLRTGVSDGSRTVGAMNLYMLVALLVQGIAPAASHVFLWPAILVLGALILIEKRSFSDTAKVALLAASGLIGALWLLYITEMGYSALGVSFPGIIMVPFGMLMLLLMPSFMKNTDCEHPVVLLASAVIGLGLVATAGLSAGFTERHRQPTEVFYAVDPLGDGTNHYASRLAEFDPWAANLMQSAEYSVKAGEFIAGRTGTIKLNPAPASSVEKVSVTNIETTDDTTSFVVAPGFRGDIMVLALSSTADMTGILLNGESILEGSKPITNMTLYYFAVPDAGLKFDITGGGAVTVFATEVSSTWPADIAPGIPAKPATIMIAPYRLSDATVSALKQTISHNKDTSTETKE
ncbi:MAG: hypothetical protein COB37_00990 [Kordiimonadales bacterium]|nr:MAG: hypothetical protein COB37_00990 [Kordiimonadales bacterium]